MKNVAGKMVVVTGSNTGIGKVTALELAKQGAHVVLACRSADKTRPVVDEIRAAGHSAEAVALDLGEFASIRRAAETIAAIDRPLAVLVNNAGLAGTRGTTKDGFEITFGTNHLGPFLLTVRLLPKLRAAASATSHARIVNVASKAHFQAKGIDWTVLRGKTPTITGVREYEVSKLANVLFTKELARGRAGEGVHSYALHPGVVASDIWRRIPWPVRPIMTRNMITNEEGAKTSIHCATSPDVEGDDGLYYDACHKKTPSDLALDEDLAKELWWRSLEMVGEKD
jgi:NAD(P)-dependent dehydrogenase (short-subunit alcohol dehydrogenase family)